MPHLIHHDPLYALSRNGFSPVFSRHFVPKTVPKQFFAYFFETLCPENCPETE